MKNIVFYTTVFLWLFSISNCKVIKQKYSGFQKFVKEPNFLKGKTIEEVAFDPDTTFKKQKIVNLPLIDSSFYVLKISEKREIKLNDDYADLPYKKYETLNGTMSDSLRVTEETYLYLHNIKKKINAITYAEEIGELTDSLKTALVNIFDLEQKHFKDLSDETYELFSDLLYETKLLESTKFEFNAFEKDFNFLIKSYQEKLSELYRKVNKIKGVKNLDDLAPDPIVQKEIQLVEIQLSNIIKQFKNTIEQKHNLPISGSAIYFITFPFQDSIRIKRYFNRMTNENNLFLDAVRHIRIGKWEKVGNEFSLYFKHLDKKLAFKGIYESGCFYLTEASHPSIAKHHSSRKLHFIELKDVLSIKTKGLPFYEKNPNRKIIPHYKYYKTYSDSIKVHNKKGSAFLEEQSWYNYPQINKIEMYATKVQEPRKNNKIIDVNRFFFIEKFSSNKRNIFQNYNRRIFEFTGTISNLTVDEFIEMKNYN